MSDDNLLSRREFTVESVLAILATATITISCGDDDNGNGPSPQPGSEVGTISANHGHDVTITAAQITAGQAIVSMSIRGNATHDHTISLSAAQITSIGAQQQVSVVSSTEEAHNHTVTFN
jgi:hypothetical protein